MSLVVLALTLCACVPVSGCSDARKISTEVHKGYQYSPRGDNKRAYDLMGV